MYEIIFKYMDSSHVSDVSELFSVFPYFFDAFKSDFIQLPSL